LIKVESYISSYTPKVGSIYGGTLLTLTGVNWGKEKTDNPVVIHSGYENNSIKNIDCLVESTSENEIKCRIDA
jgi:hypothetical protein